MTFPKIMKKNVSVVHTGKLNTSQTEKKAINSINNVERKFLFIILCNLNNGER